MQKACHDAMKTFNPMKVINIYDDTIKDTPAHF